MITTSWFTAYKHEADPITLAIRKRVQNCKQDSRVMPGGVGFVDCHCHLASPEFDADLEDVLSRAKNANVRAIVVVPEFFNQFEKLLEICHKHPDLLLPCLGIHPSQRLPDGQARGATPSDLVIALPFMKSHHEELVGIGEVGLDFTQPCTRDQNGIENQKIVLHEQIAFAEKYNLPLNVHSRLAGSQTIKELKDKGATKVVLHAYSGDADSAMEGAGAGYYFSIPPEIARVQQKVKIVERLPMDNLLLETDSPVLGPDKLVRNEPANIKISCEWIAKIKRISPEDVQRITTENACKLFPKLRQMLNK